MTRKRKKLDPIHPGETLLEEFLKPMGISINRLARDISVPPGRISGAGDRTASSPVRRLIPHPTQSHT